MYDVMKEEEDLKVNNNDDDTIDSDSGTDIDLTCVPVGNRIVDMTLT